ncbi:MAG: molybdate ABC transporter substrate-binding protein [Pseudomonadota bacterium]
MPKLICLIVIWFLAISPTAQAAEKVTVFAAASLKTALDEIAEGYRDATGVEIVPVYAASSALARQIAYGAPADIFVSANTAWMDYLDREGVLADGTRQDLLGNQLGVIGWAGLPWDGFALDKLADTLGDEKISMALIDAVPAGIYGRQSLEALGLWSEIAPNVAQTDNVRAALALVATGAAPLGIVYTSDARAEPRVDLLNTLPAESHDPIRYPAAAIAGQERPETMAFLNYLTAAEALRIFERHGFLVAEF